MFELVRLETLHPALVHLPLGAIPLALLAYVVASIRRSTRWLFVADVTLAFSAVVAAVAAGFGYLAYFELHWPGSLNPWPLVHLLLGTTTTVLLALLAIARWRVRAKRKAQAVASPAALPERTWRWTYGSLAVTLLAGTTGYLGGEILVFHGGMAVKASAEGALAPPLTLNDESPGAISEAMHRLQAIWASCIIHTAHAVVERPSDDDFRRVVDDAQRMQRLARWVSDWAGQHDPERHANEQGSEMTELAQRLETQASALEQAAQTQNLREAMEALGRTGGACAECHEHKRWSHAPAAAAPSR